MNSRSIGPRQEEVLSYLIGLGPVGDPIPLPVKWMCSDLGLIREHVYRHLRGLIRRGYAEWVEKSHDAGLSGKVRVLRRVP